MPKKCQHVEAIGSRSFHCHRPATRDGGTKCGFHSTSYQTRKELNRKHREERRVQQEAKDNARALLILSAISIAMRVDPGFAERWMAMEDMPPKERKKS